MKFIIRRTSEWDYKKPCKEAQEINEELTYIMLEEPGKLNKKDHQQWSIEINSLKELLKFLDKQESPIIINNSWFKEYPYEIEIYDDYRE